MAAVGHVMVHTSEVMSYSYVEGEIDAYNNSFWRYKGITPASLFLFFAASLTTTLEFRSSSTHLPKICPRSN